MSHVPSKRIVGVFEGIFWFGFFGLCNWRNGTRYLLKLLGELGKCMKLEVTLKLKWKWGAGNIAGLVYLGCDTPTMYVQMQLYRI